MASNGHGLGSVALEDVDDLVMLPVLTVSLRCRCSECHHAGAACPNVAIPVFPASLKMSWF